MGLEIRGVLDTALAAWRTSNVELAGKQIERASRVLVEALHAEGLSQSEDDFLLAQAVEVNSRICDDALRAADLMAPVTA
jgi:hypothetical protein